MGERGRGGGEEGGGEGEGVWSRPKLAMSRPNGSRELGWKVYALQGPAKVNNAASILSTGVSGVHLLQRDGGQGDVCSV